MVDAQGRFVITFNGEIYNYQELRMELENAGHRLVGRSDTEVLLHAYMLWGDACLARLNGMFAFAIYDAGTATSPPSLFLARDRAGKKPLYYSHSHGSLRFASELKALDQHGELDVHALNHYLALGYYPGERCVFQGIKKLLPGFAAKYDLNDVSLHTWKWWEIPAAEDQDEDPDHLARQMGNLLEDSVRRRLVSDVPVGVFLSGGMDSSLVVAAAAHVSGKPVKTFTIRVPALGFDESSYARIVANRFGTEHHELVADSTSLSILDEMETYFDEPLGDSSVIPTYLVSRLTRGYVTVALGGDGGDELFGGYPHVKRALYFSSRCSWIPKQAWHLLGNLAARLPGGLKGRNRLQSWREGPLFERAWGTPFFDPSARQRILGLEVLDEIGEGLLAPELEMRKQLGRDKDPVYSICKTDFSTALVDDFLVKVDRASMMNALEIRAPFLDVRLVEFAFRRVPSALKCDGQRTRIIQRRLAQAWLPETLDLERKQGFSVPLGDWFRGAGTASILERLDGLPDIFDRPSVEDEIHQHMRGRENGSRIFALLMLAACSRRISAR